MKKRNINAFHLSRGIGFILKLMTQNLQIEVLEWDTPRNSAFSGTARKL